MIERLAAWLLRRVGPGPLVGGGLLGLLLGSVALGLGQAAPTLDENALALSALLGALLAWWLARISPPGEASRRAPAEGVGVALWLAVAGLMWNLLHTGRLAGSLLAAGLAGLRWLDALWLWRPGAALPAPWPFLAALDDLRLRLALLAGRSVAWATGLGRSAAQADPLATGLAWGLLLWAVGAWAGWRLRQRRSALAASLPAAGLLAAALAFSRASPLYLLPTLGAALGLMAWLAFDQQRADWQRRQIDSAEGLAFDLSLWTLAQVLGVISLAYLLARISPQGTLDALQRLLQAPPEANAQLSQSLGLQPPPTPTPPPPLPGVLPRSRLIGAGPELGQQVVMEVRVDDGPQTIDARRPPPLYWAAAAYDIYTGHGWLTSPTRREDYPPGQPVSSTLPGPAAPLTLTVQLPGAATLDAAGQPQPVQVYFAGQLTGLNQPFAANWRSAPELEADLFRAWLPQPPPGGAYRVQARRLLAGEADLRRALDPPPGWIRERYLALPASLPGRVRSLGAALGGSADTPYDRAKAIERFLRRYPYSLDLPAPPSDQDLSAYFLFGVRRGYCDYYATAMVVLARAAGLPSRLVVGYAQGTPLASVNPLRPAFRVTEAEAHSWPEIYFSGLGWVAFEPTSSRPPLERPSQSLQPPAPLPARPPAGPAGGGLRSAWRAAWAAIQAAIPYMRGGLGLLAGAAALLALAAGAAAWIDGLRLRRLPPGLALAEVYIRLRRAGQRLALPQPPGQTPYEFAAQWQVWWAGLPADGARWTGWLRRRVRRALAAAPTQAHRIVDPYTRSAYSLHPPDRQTAGQAISAWQALQFRLWLARLF